MNIIVIGCGVCGLSSAIQLLEIGHSVTIWARDLPPHTTSNVAAAVWFPYKAYPEHLVTKWGQQTFEIFGTLANDPETGIVMKQCVMLLDQPEPPPVWHTSVRAFRSATQPELQGYTDGYAFETPVIEMPMYMNYLMRRFQQAGGTVVQREVHQLEEPLQACDVVINCTGLGARALVHDTAMYPIRGQIVRVGALEGQHVVLDESSDWVTYIVPRLSDCIFGGTSDEGNWSLEPDPATASAIVARCQQLLPEGRNIEVLEHLVGLRPGRDQVRLEREVVAANKLVVHNYGHGGAGVTLSWGCAQEVAELVGV